MIDELSEIFALLGFQTVFGPEVETGRYNFDLLNIPSDHPARDVWDTIIVDPPRRDRAAHPHLADAGAGHGADRAAGARGRARPRLPLRGAGRLPRVDVPPARRVWRSTSNITMADLKGVLPEMARQLFGPERRIRFRCDFFPFVEPGVDFAVDCAICGGDGCRVCKGTGWLEMGGAGMVHPNVLRGVGYDPDVYSGFAFGLGIERLSMMQLRRRRRPRLRRQRSPLPPPVRPCGLDVRRLVAA